MATKQLLTTKEKKPSAKEQALMQAAQELEQTIKRKEQEFSTTAIYAGYISDVFNENLIAALCETSDIMLQLPFHIYEPFVNKVVNSEPFTYQEINIAMQVISVATPNQLNLTLSEYLILKADLRKMAVELDEAITEAKVRIRKESTKSKDGISYGKLDRTVTPDLEVDATCIRYVHAHGKERYCKVKDGVYWEINTQTDEFIKPFCKIEEITYIRGISGHEI